MFGDNPVRKQMLQDDGSLYVSDIFPTIQGEGPHSGTPAIFIRLSGCNLQCPFCDTDFETSRKLMSVRDVADTVEKHDSHGLIDLVVITGGEPFLQNLLPLLEELFYRRFHVQVETAGTVSIVDFPWRKVDIVVSPKTPKVHEDFFHWAEHWKYIVTAYPGCTNVRDGLPQKSPDGPVVARPPRTATVWVQPMDEQDQSQNDANLALCLTLAMRHGYRLSLQLHKILGVK